MALEMRRQLGISFCPFVNGDCVLFECQFYEIGGFNTVKEPLFLFLDNYCDDSLGSLYSDLLYAKSRCNDRKESNEKIYFSRQFAELSKRMSEYVIDIAAKNEIDVISFDCDEKLADVQAGLTIEYSKYQDKVSRCLIKQATIKYLSE